MPLIVENEFKVGDVVSLKSGGPSMTVEMTVEMTEAANQTNEYLINCIWFECDVIHRDGFLSSQLIKVL